MKLAAIILAALSGSACATTIDPVAEFSELSFNETDSFHIGKIMQVQNLPRAKANAAPEMVTVMKTATQNFAFKGYCADPGEQTYLMAMRKLDKPFTAYGWGKDPLVTAYEMRKCKPVNANTKMTTPMLETAPVTVTETRAIREYSGFIANSYLVGMGSIDTIISDHLATELVYDVDKDPILFLGKCGDKAERVTISVKKTDRNIYELLECRKADTIGT